MKAIVLCTDGKNVSSRKPHTNHSPNSHSDEKIIHSRMSYIHLSKTPFWRLIAKFSSDVRLELWWDKVATVRSYRME